MIDLTIHKDGLEGALKRARENKIIIPTFKQLRDPDKYVPQKIKDALKNIGTEDVNPLNLFRITWKNEPRRDGGNYGGVNYVEIPKALTGVDARIFVMTGKWFPTGCHKVGASYGCLVPRLVTGQFNPYENWAVWPSTGNYARGGSLNSRLLGCKAIAILPAEMSQERFDWLKNMAEEVIATPGCESDVYEVFEKVKEIRRTRPEAFIFNQFEEMGNVLWHYHATGPALEDLYNEVKTEDSRLSGAFFTSGSGGSMSAGDYLKEKFPHIKVSVGEALQCPTILNNGFGAHRIEGIGDKHIPFVHNVKNTDMVCAIDDNNSQNLLRLFNSEIGHDYLVKETGVSKDLLEELSLLGISGIANVLGLIKMARYYEMTDKDVLVTVATDSAEMYQSRIAELDECEVYTPELAARDYWHHLKAIKTDNMMELNYWERKRVHNLKYYTWVEQQGRTLEELNAQWYDDKYWDNIHAQVDEIDRLTEEFNKMSGVLESL